MKKILFLIITILIFAPFVVGAQNLDWDVDECDDIRSQGYDSAAKLCELMKDIEVILYIFGIGLAVIIVILGGVQYMTSQGDDNKIDKAKKTLTYGLIGAAIVMASGFIISMVADIVLGKIVN
ncbi:MAG: hypothetical protein GF387_01500 [Candidatus Portnoybacteria bacterium]|nr:hypothetical protein [Candidatus Portnoybacteria bacterium]